MLDDMCHIIMYTHKNDRWSSSPDLLDVAQIDFYLKCFSSFSFLK